MTPMKSNDYVKSLKKDKFSPVRSSGSSHEVFACITGKHTVSVPTGHKIISPGVQRTIGKLVKACDCG